MVVPQQQHLRERLASQQWTQRVGELLKALLAPSRASPQPAAAQPSTSSSAEPRNPQHAAEHSHALRQSTDAPTASQQQRQDAAGEEAGGAESLSLAPWPPLPAPRPVASTQALALQGPLPRGMTSVSCLLDEARSSGGSQGRISVSDLLGRASAPLPSQHRLAVSSSEGAQPMCGEELGPPRASSSKLHSVVRARSFRSACSVSNPVSNRQHSQGYPEQSGTMHGCRCRLL